MDSRRRVGHGCDIQLARVVLTMTGKTSIEFVPVAFDELLGGVSGGRWDMNVPIFVTPERERRVTFSVPVWSLSDGFVVRRGNPKSLSSYSSVGSDRTARLGLIPGQVQFDAAQAAGVPADQIVTFVAQPETASALLDGRIDAFAATWAIELSSPTTPNWSQWRSQNPVRSGRSPSQRHLRS